MDNILLVENNLEYMKIIKSLLSKSFYIKHMDELDYLLVVKIQKDHSKKIVVYLKKHA